MTSSRWTLSRNYRGGLDAVASLGALNRTPRKAVAGLADWKALTRQPKVRRPRRTVAVDRNPPPTGLCAVHRGCVPPPKLGPQRGRPSPRLCPAMADAARAGDRHAGSPSRGLVGGRRDCYSTHRRRPGAGGGGAGTTPRTPPTCKSETVVGTKCQPRRNPSGSEGGR